MAKKNVTHARKGFLPAFDRATMQRMEEAAQSQGLGQQRRCALLVCSSDSDTVVRHATENPATFDELADMVIEYHKYAKATLKIATAAFARIAIAHEMSLASRNSSVGVSHA